MKPSSLPQAKRREKDQQLTRISSSATRVQRPRLVATCEGGQICSARTTFRPLCLGVHTLTACLAWMFADPSARMVLKMGFRVLNTSSLSMPEPSWMHRRQARDAAARCSSPLPGRNGNVGVSLSPPTPPAQENYQSESPGTFLEAALDAVRDGHPPLRDELVQDARGHRCLEPVQRPLSGLCAGETSNPEFYFSPSVLGCGMGDVGKVADLLSTVLSMNPFSLYWKSSWAVSSLASPPGSATGLQD